MVWSLSNKKGFVNGGQAGVKRLAVAVIVYPAHTYRAITERAERYDAVWGFRGGFNPGFNRCLHRHGDWGRWLTLKVARESTGMTLWGLGEAMGGMDYAAVCMGLRRFDQRLKQERTSGKMNEIYERVRK